MFIRLSHQRPRVAFAWITLEESGIWSPRFVDTPTRSATVGGVVSWVFILPPSTCLWGVRLVMRTTPLRRARRRRWRGVNLSLACCGRDSELAPARLLAVEPRLWRYPIRLECDVVDLVRFAGPTLVRCWRNLGRVIVYPLDRVYRDAMAGIVTRKRTRSESSCWIHRDRQDRAGCWGTCAVSPLLD